jgi:hypothetical protein
MTAAVLATAAALVPQFLAWRAIYGSYVTIPQGAGFMRWTDPAVLSVLVSTRHGLWMWTPALVPAFAGLWFVYRANRLVGVGMVCLFAVTVYINAAVADWFAGEAFGARRFVGDTVVFALGLSALAAWIDRRGRRWILPIMATAVITYNVLFLLQYQLFMRGYRDIAPYPTTVREVLVDRLLVPYRALHAWTRRSAE